MHTRACSGEAYYWYMLVNETDCNVHYIINISGGLILVSNVVIVLYIILQGLINKLTVKCLHASLRCSKQKLLDILF